MNTERASHIAFLQSLDLGDSVTLTTEDGKSHEMTVLRRFMRGDGGGFGSTDFATVKVGFGWGRYCVDVHAVALENGTYVLERMAGVPA